MPKYIFTFILLFLCSFLSLSQSRRYTLGERNYSYSLLSPGAIDTISYIDPPGALYTATDGGYVSGTNAYGDIGKYQRFDLDMNYSLVEFAVVFGEKGVVGTADTIYFVVKDVGENGSPGTTLYTKILTTDDLDTTNLTSIIVDPPLAGNDSIFIGFEWTSAVDDSFGLISDSDPDGNGQNRAWEKWDGGQYSAFNGGQGTWELDIDLWIAAIIETSTGVESITPSGFSLSQNYPNPFNPKTKISFSLNVDSKVIIKIFNLLGEEITTLTDDIFSAGLHTVDFNAVNMQSGIYFYEFRSEGTNGAINNAVKKMMLVK